MNDVALELEPVSAEEIIVITQEVWSSFLQLELEPVGTDPRSSATEGLVATVQLSGAWAGAVQLECPPGHAAAAAGQMFSTAAAGLSEEQVHDALGELANIVTGNVKSLLPSPSALSLPSVASGGSGEAPLPGASLVCRVAFVAAPGDLHVSVWKERSR
jgi:chemotaxis protein CheX